jgi:hypothetical protein
MRWIALAAVSVALLWGSLAGRATAEEPCGMMPIPEPGCWIGRCVDGEWEEFCPHHDAVRCGVKPVPNFGCRIGGCKHGEWQQICDDPDAIDCGPEPIPPVGCRIGRCIEGHWEQICNEPLPMTPLD